MMMRKTSDKILLRTVAFGGVALLTLAAALPTTLHDYVYGFMSGNAVYIPGAYHAVTQKEIAEDHTTEHSFRIYNLRSTPLHIAALPSCPCTHLSWRSTTIPPLAWQELLVHTDMSGAGFNAKSVALQVDKESKPLGVYLFRP